MAETLLVVLLATVGVEEVAIRLPEADMVFLRLPPPAPAPAPLPAALDGFRAAPTPMRDIRPARLRRGVPAAREGVALRLPPRREPAEWCDRPDAMLRLS